MKCTCYIVYWFDEEHEDEGFKLGKVASEIDALVNDKYPGKEIRVFPVCRDSKVGKLVYE